MTQISIIAGILIGVALVIVIDCYMGDDIWKL